MESEPTGAFAAIRKRPWGSLLLTLFVLSAALLFYLRANISFFLDDWDLVLIRDGASDWFLPHNQHIIILPAAIYELSLTLFGMDALPLHLVALALFLVSVVLLFLWLRPLIGEPVSVLACAVVLFLGAATGDLVFAFQIGFFGSVVGGLGALVLLRRETRRGDIGACLLLVFSVLCSTVMAPFVLAVVVQLLYRGDERPDLSRLLRSAWIVLIPLAVYLIWWFGWNQNGSQEASLENALKTPAYVLAALGFAGASLTGAFPLRDIVTNYLWVIPGVAIAVGFAWILRRRGKVPPEFLIGLAAGLGFWVLCGLNYTEARDFYTSRYQYPSVIFLLMMLAGACRDLRPDAQQLKWLAGLTAVAVAINVAGLFYAFHNVYKEYEEKNLVSLATVDIAWDTVDPEFRVGLGTDGGGAQLSAEAYKAAVGRYGRPDLTEGDLTGFSADNRARLDQLLVLALPVRVLSASKVAPIRSGCQTLAANPGATDRIELPSSLTYISARQDAVIRLERYGDSAGAAGWLKGGRPIGYLVPRDRSDVPWRIGFQGEGEVTVCPARPA